MMADTKEFQANRATVFVPRAGIVGATKGARPANPRYDDRRSISNGSRIKLSRIKPDPNQPRQTFGTDADERLAESMRTRGQIVPVIVRWSAADEMYVIVDGGRRYNAALAAGLAEMLCVEEDEADPDVILEMQLVTNALREDVPPTEQAEAWRRLMRSQGLTERELADKLGYSQGTINKKVALLDLPEPIRRDVDSGAIKAETGYFIAQVADPAEQQAMAEEAKAGTLRRDDARQRVARSKATTSGKGAKNKSRGVKSKPITSRVFKAEGGLKITAERSRGLDLVALLEALEMATETIRSEVAELG